MNSIALHDVFPVSARNVERLLRSGLSSVVPLDQQTTVFDLEITGDDVYRLTLPVPGYSTSDLEVTQHGQKLRIKAKPKDENTGRRYLYRGIETREFTKVFYLEKHARPVKAYCNDGILTIELVHEIPEEQKPRTIPIS